MVLICNTHVCFILLHPLVDCLGVIFFLCDTIFPYIRDCKRVYRSCVIHFIYQFTAYKKALEDAVLDKIAVPIDVNDRKLPAFFFFFKK